MIKLFWKLYQDPSQSLCEQPYNQTQIQNQRALDAVNRGKKRTATVTATSKVIHLWHQRQQRAPSKDS